MRERRQNLHIRWCLCFTVRGTVEQQLCLLLQILPSCKKKILRSTLPFPAFGNLNFVSSPHRRALKSLSKPCPNVGFTYLQSMDFQREPQSKHHLYCEQEKPAHCHGSLLLRLGTHQIQNRTRDAHKISPQGTRTKRTPAMNWDHVVSWGGDLG